MLSTKIQKNGSHPVLFLWGVRDELARIRTPPQCGFPRQTGTSSHPYDAIGIPRSKVWLLWKVPDYFQGIWCHSTSCAVHSPPGPCPMLNDSCVMSRDCMRKPSAKDRLRADQRHVTKADKHGSMMQPFFVPLCPY